MKTSRKAFTLIELLIVVAIIAILAAIAVPNFLEAQARSKISRARADMRSIATAIEAYRLDNNVYPAWSQHVTGELTLASPFANFFNNPAHDFYTWLYNFRVPRGPAENFGTVTSPIAYMTSIPPDPFADVKGGPYGYYHTANNRAWILYSFGPQRAYGINFALDMDRVNESTENTTYNYLLNPYGSNPTVNLQTGMGVNNWAGGAYSYDATNGTRSFGNVWRVGP
jgi:type II secretion system protein G